MSASYFMLRLLQGKRRKKTRETNQRILSQKEDGETLTNIHSKQVMMYFKCRVCLKEASIPIFDAQSSINISNAVQAFGGIDISELDDFPKHLCASCYSLLEGAILFRKYAIETDKLLRRRAEVNEEIPIEFEATCVDNDHEKASIFEESIDTYKCRICRQTFINWNEYLTHKSTKHRKNVRIQCKTCHAVITAQLYEKHLARHQSSSHLICDVCGKLYRKDNLLRHLQLHSYELPYQCQMCPYRGRFLESLKIHMRTHSGDKPFSCDKCNVCFLTRSNLNRHLLTHKKEKPFKCMECGRGFYTKRDMAIHFKSDHAGIKDFDCRLCGNKYGTRKALMRHELRVHKRDKMAKGRMPLFLQDEYRKCEDL